MSRFHIPYISNNNDCLRLDSILNIIGKQKFLQNQRFCSRDIIIIYSFLSPEHNHTWRGVPEGVPLKYLGVFKWKGDDLSYETSVTPLLYSSFKLLCSIFFAFVFFSDTQSMIVISASFMQIYYYSPSTGTPIEWREIKKVMHIYTETTSTCILVLSSYILI